MNQIPSMTTSLVLPPFLGDSPGSKANMSPYVVTMKDVVERFATSKERIELLSGLLAYRDALRSIGLSNGYQWLDGSFVEDVEHSKRRRPPKDIDIVTFSESPYSDEAAKIDWFQKNKDLFTPKFVKRQFKCDAHFVDFRNRPHLLVDDARYWFGLFSHQYGTNLWKGMLQVPMVSNDAEANVLLASLLVNFEEA